MESFAPTEAQRDRHEKCAEGQAKRPIKETAERKKEGPTRGSAAGERLGSSQKTRLEFPRTCGGRIAARKRTGERGVRICQ